MEEGGVFKYSVTAFSSIPRTTHESGPGNGEGGDEERQDPLGPLTNQASDPHDPYANVSNEESLAPIHERTLLRPRRPFRTHQWPPCLIGDPLEETGPMVTVVGHGTSPRSPLRTHPPWTSRAGSLDPRRL